jgi:hypothetical protein
MHGVHVDDSTELIKPWLIFNLPAYFPKHIPNLQWPQYPLPPLPILIKLLVTRRASVERRRKGKSSIVIVDRNYRRVEEWGFALREAGMVFWQGCCLPLWMSAKPMTSSSCKISTALSVHALYLSVTAKNHCLLLGLAC